MARTWAVRTAIVLVSAATTTFTDAPTTQVQGQNATPCTSPSPCPWQNNNLLGWQELGARAAAVQAKEEKEKEELDSLMQPKDLDAKKAEEKKAAQADGNKRKPPTLYRKDEKKKE